MQNTQKPRVLITNDDGIRSGYMLALAGALAPIADVCVFAPEEEQSGVSHAFTVRRALSVKKVKMEEPVEAYSMSGTPADCVKFALGHFASHGLSTEGAGPGPGVSSLYSGTVAGAREAALWGVPGIALSLHGVTPNMLEFAKVFAVRIVQGRLFERIPAGVFWNVNFPKATAETFKGFRATRMALGMFTDHYSHEGGLWQLDGDKLWNEQPVDSDDYLLEQGYATVTPQRIDQTDEKSLEVINGMLAGNGQPLTRG